MMTIRTGCSTAARTDPWLLMFLIQFALLLPGATAFSPRRLPCSTTTTRLFFASTTPSAPPSVVFQKVVRSPPQEDDNNMVFLGNLIEYLQEVFKIPDRLPMTYEQYTVDDDPEGTVLRMDSSLSPHPSVTQLNVQVVAMVDAPSLAMVVVKKQAATTIAIPPMMVNLFADAESKILAALDKGLDSLSSGKVQGLLGRRHEDASAREVNRTSSYLENQQAMLQDFLEDYDLSPDQFIDTTQPKTDHSNEIIDAVIEKPSTSKATTTKASEQQRRAALETMKGPPEEKPLASSAGLDFAVYAAKLAQEKRNKKKKSTAREGDFAVEAAKRRREAMKESKGDFTVEAAKLRRESMEGSKKEVIKKGTTKSSEEADSSPQDAPANKAAATESDPWSSQRLPILDASAPDRRFMTSISRPEDYVKRAKKIRTTTTKRKKLGDKTKKPASKKKPTKGAAVKPPTETPDPTTARVAEPKAGNSDKKVKQPQRKLNIRTTQEKVPSMEPIPPTSTDPLENERIQSTQQALDQLAASGKDMTPEELLADVMKFGEANRRENAPGAGFASGALESAKEMLQSQRAKREERLRENSNVKTVETLTPDEELRRMFAAGEQLADGRITTTTQPGTMELSRDEEELVDSVIATDKTISSHARVLDDELAELELRISRSVGEEFDGPSQNPLFDVFSGPEVYDRNVDPETAVNWPGALPGTRTTRLPKELDEAKKQATFAVNALMNMKEIESGNGKKEYTFRNKKLSEEQVENLRRLVEDAVELGIIDDPVQLQAEEARLQMLLDELWNQPDDRSRSIASNYKDLLLSDHFVEHVKKRLFRMAERDMSSRRKDEIMEQNHQRERDLLGYLVSYTQLLLKEARALGAELEAHQLEVIRSICRVAMDPRHRTEEETAAALTDAVRDMRPLFDDAFIAYLKYAVAEEEGRLARAGLLDDPEESKWLMVLQIVQRGVYAEIAKGINRYLEHVWYILRMETPVERRLLLEELVNVMPTLDVRPFVRVIENIAGSLGDSVKGEFDGAVPLGEMTNKILQLYRDTKEVLPPERIAEKSRDADEWAAKQKQRLLEQRNLTRQRLEAAVATEHLDEEIEAMGRSGEFDRFD